MQKYFWKDYNLFFYVLRERRSPGQTNETVASMCQHISDKYDKTHNSYKLPTTPLIKCNNVLSLKAKIET